MHSCLYVGSVRHRRFSPVVHAFRYGLFQVYLDLDELDTAFRGRWLWSARRPALAWLRREDHLGDPALPLKRAVQDLVEVETGRPPEGPIRLLTHLRYFGYCFNPVSFYYCFDAAGEKVTTLVAEITNTPWGERHCYVLPAAQSKDAGRHQRFRFAKDFHVSPFMPMDIDYDWRFSQPRDRLAVHMENFRDGEKVFDATLRLERRPISGPSLAAALLRHPFMTLAVIRRIYWQALRLRLKHVPFHPHPAKPGSRPETHP
ncbi:MAG: DUF1365 domain-containing protein [Gammaproteobacteria bacterium]